MERKVKQVIIIRKDLKMRRGKEIAQGSHASSAFLFKNINSSNVILLDDITLEWLKTGHTKITLVVDSLEELQNLFDKAISLNLKANLITDWGLTEFNGVHTITSLAIGPNFSDEIDEVTKHLKTY